MIMWDKMAMKKYEEIGMRMMMYLRYVDDVNCAAVAMPEGSTFVDGKIVITEDRKLEDMRMTSDKRTGRLLREVANSVMPTMIQMVEDCPSNHVSGKIPILDLEVWTEMTEEEEEERRPRPVIKHRFFKNKMASEATLNSRSAYPTMGTRATLMEETLRRLRNNSPEVRWEDKGKFLTKWTLAMMRGGHTERFRRDIVDRAVKRYLGELSDHNEGKRDIYRSREERERQMMERGGRNRKATWFRKTDRKTGKEITAMFKVKMTERETLKKIVEKKMSQFAGPEGIHAKVIEEGGRTLKSFLVKGDPFPRTKCSRKECAVNEGSCGEVCYTRNANYMLSCNRCDDILEEKMVKIQQNEEAEGGGGGRHKDGGNEGEEGDEEQEDLERNLYGGETSRSIHHRYRQHLEGYKGRKNHLWEHVRKKHEGEIGEAGGIKDFKLELTGVDKEVMRRVVRESVKLRRIANGEDEKSEEGIRGCGEVRRGKNSRNMSSKEKKLRKRRKKVKMRLLNDHNEWFTPKLVTVSLTQL
jgi:hypothetical protein